MSYKTLHFQNILLDSMSREKNYPNMSFSLAKAVVALCLLHITEKLFVQYHHILAGWLHKESTQVHFQFAIPYLMCLWRRWEVFYRVNTYLCTSQCVRAVWKKKKKKKESHKERCKLRSLSSRLLNSLICLCSFLFRSW